MHDLRNIFFSGADAATVIPASPTSGVQARVEPADRNTFSRRDDFIGEPDPLVIWVLEKAGVDVHAYRPQPLVRRLPACLRQLRTNCPVSALNLLERRAELVPAVLDSLLIGVSAFFRDAAVFDHLHTVVLPELLAKKRHLRICSVGASGGQELYSLAILLAELGALDGAELLGVDCRPEAIKGARTGCYAPLEGLPERYRDRYFRPNAEGWVILDQLRRQTRWEISDLFAWQNAGTWDLILFRNVAIYLKDSHAAAAWEKLAARLVPGGCFVTGKAEVPPRHLALTRSASSVYRKF